MVRLMLVLAPVVCVLSGIGISTILTTYMKNLDSGSSGNKDKKVKKFDDYPKKAEVRSLICIILLSFHKSN